MNIECKRCGECCNYTDKKGKKKYCPHLSRSDKITSCDIYENRLGVIIYPGIPCSNRLEHEMFHPGCPYNLLIAAKLNRI